MKDYYIDSPPPRPQRARRRQSPLAPTPCRAAAADDAVLPLKVAYISALLQAKSMCPAHLVLMSASSLP